MGVAGAAWKVTLQNNSTRAGGDLLVGGVSPPTLPSALNCVSVTAGIVDWMRIATPDATNSKFRFYFSDLSSRLALRRISDPTKSLLAQNVTEINFIFSIESK